MKRKILSFVLVLCLIVPFAFMLSACGANNNGGGEENAGLNYEVNFVVDNGSSVEKIIDKSIQTEPTTTKLGYDFDGWFDNENFSGTKILFPYSITENKTFYAKWVKHIAYSNNFNGVKIIENSNKSDMSVGSETYLFATKKVEEIETLAAELLLRLSGYFGDGLKVETAESYGIIIENDIMPESTEGYSSVEAVFNDNWIWWNISDKNILPYPCTDKQFIDVYINAYNDGTIIKDNYKEKLIKNLYNELIDIMPENLEQETLINIAKNFEHSGFSETEQEIISDFILDEIIGTATVSNDNLFYNEFFHRMGYRNYRIIVPQLVEDAVNRMIGTERAYSEVKSFFTKAKMYDSTQYIKDNNTQNSITEKNYAGFVLDAKTNSTITSMTINFNATGVDDGAIKVYCIQRSYDSSLSEFVNRNKYLGTATITNGVGQLIINSFIDEELELDEFVNNTKSTAEYVYGTNKKTDAYFGMIYVNSVAKNLGYVDDTTSSCQFAFKTEITSFGFTIEDVMFSE